MAVRPYKPEENKWWIDISLGRKYQHREVFEGTYEKAVVYEQELKKYLAQREKHKGTIMIRQIAEEYLQFVKIHQAEGTFKEKQRILSTHIIPFLVTFLLTW